MTQGEVTRKKTGKYIPKALTSSRLKNQSLGRTRRRKERAGRSKKRRKALRRDNGN